MKFLTMENKVIARIEALERILPHKAKSEALNRCESYYDSDLTLLERDAEYLHELRYAYKVHTDKLSMQNVWEMKRAALCRKKGKPTSWLK